LKFLSACNSFNGSISKVALEKSEWLKHLKTILDGALIMVKSVHDNNAHVLVHCSDGWDRTAQLSSLSQLCLDPYYRTIEGFQVLLEKEWIAFGHKFKDRCGHLSKGQKSHVEPNKILSASKSMIGAASKFFGSSNSGLRESSDLSKIFF
jgi:hypothetical protein